MDLYGVGDHGGGPTRDVLDQGLHWMDPQTIAPKMRFGTALSFFTDIQPKINAQSPTWNYTTLAAGKPDLATPPEGQISIPTWRDELYLEYHRGTYTTQAAEKRNLRQGEEWMLNAEKAASLAWLDGDAYPSTQMNDAWKKVLFNGFHDLAAGSGVGTIYRDAADDFRQVHGATDQIESKALHTILSAVDTHTAAGVPVVIFNPLSWERSGPVELKYKCRRPRIQAFLCSMKKDMSCPAKCYRRRPTRTPTNCLCIPPGCHPWDIRCSMSYQGNAALTAI